MARRTTTATTATGTKKRTPKKEVTPTPGNVPVKNATPFVELSYALKQGNGYSVFRSSNIRVFHTQANEITLFEEGGRAAKFQLDKLIALVGAAAALPVGQAGS